MNESEILKIFKPFGVKHLFPCGSRITCDPSVMDTDEDWMVLTAESEIMKLNASLESDEFSLGGSIVLNKGTLMPPDLFWSYMKGDLNLLITCCPDFFNKFRIATETSKKLNLLDKAERIILFQAILYGKT